MASIGTVLNNEIRRQAKKEIRKQTLGIKEDNTTLRKNLQTLKKRIEALEKNHNKLSTRKRGPGRPRKIKSANQNGKTAPITGTMIKSQRKKMKITQAQFAGLLGVHPITIVHWEKKKGRIKFRGNSSSQILRVKSLGPKAVARRLNKLGL